MMHTLMFCSFLNRLDNHNMLASILHLLQPFFALQLDNVVVSLGGGAAIDARLCLPLTSRDVDGRLVSLKCASATTSATTSACACTQRVATAAGRFRAEWVRIARTANDRDEWLDEWFPAPLMLRDFEGDPELRKGTRVGEFVGNAWVGTVANDYMDKLVILVKHEGRTHKLVEISCGGLR